MRGAYVYIISNKSRRLYIGATTDLRKRVQEHKTKTYPNGFSARYNFDRLVYFEALRAYDEALARERYLKGWTWGAQGRVDSGTQSKMAGSECGLERSLSHQMSG